MNSNTVLCLLMAATVLGCRPSFQQIDLEYRAAAAIEKFLSLHEARFAGTRITNVAEAFALMDLDSSHPTHPYVLQEEFKKYKDNAGFTKSFYDKYVCPPSGVHVTNQAIRGELAVMNALPFPDAAGRMGRILVVRAGEQDYRFSFFEEKRVQEIFKAAGRKIPEVTPSSPPVAVRIAEADPPRIRMEKYFRDVAGNLGIGRGSWWIVLLVYVGAAVAVFGVLFLWFSKSRGP